MAAPIHSQQTDVEGLHRPKGFDAAGNATALTKDENGNLIYQLISDIGSGETGPVGPAGTITDDQNRGLFNGLSTGFLGGGIISIDVDTTKFDVSAGSGWIIDNHTDPDNPVEKYLTWPAFNAQTVPDILTQETTHVAIQEDVGNPGIGELVLQGAVFTESQYRTLITLGALFHPDMTNITSVGNFAVPAFNGILTLLDFANTLGPTINKTGNIMSGASAGNLRIQKSSGETFRMGLNRPTATITPNIVTDALANPVAILFDSFRDGSGGFSTNGSTTVIDPTKFDNGSGALQTVSTNNWTVMRLFFSSNDSQIVTFMYGQVEFNTQADAVASITDPTASFIVDPILEIDSTFRAWLVVSVNATDLTDPALATFVTVESVSGGTAGAAGTATNLQAAYNASVEPEITTTATRGAVTFQKGAGAADEILEIKDESGAKVLDVLDTEIKAVKQAYAPTEVLTDSATINTNATLGNVFKVTVAGNRTLANPTNLKDGATYIWRIIQDPTGTRIITFGTAFKFPGGVVPVLSKGSNAIDYLTGISNGTEVHCTLTKDFS